MFLLPKSTTAVTNILQSVNIYSNVSKNKNRP